MWLQGRTGMSDCCPETHPTPTHPRQENCAASSSTHELSEEAVCRCESLGKRALRNLGTCNALKWKALVVSNRTRPALAYLGGKGASPRESTRDLEHMSLSQMLTRTAALAIDGTGNINWEWLLHGGSATPSVELSPSSSAIVIVTLLRL